MKVNGHLEVAQLEQLAADPALLPTGRVWMNIANAARAIPKVFDGTQIQTLQFASTTIVFSQSSGQAVTVDWSRGLVQQVILTNNCLISFTNPQAGQFHRLIVTQATYTSATPKKLYQYKLSMTDQDCQRNAYQPVGLLPANENQLYTWYYSAGIRTTYATIPAAMPTPFANIAALSSGIDISPDGKNVVFGRAASPFIANQLFFDAGQRAMLMANNVNGAPGAGAAQFIQVRYSPFQDVLFAVTGTSPFLQSYSVQNSTAQGVSIFGNPGTLPTGAGQCLDVHPSGNYVIVGHTTTPFMSAYPYDQAGFGTKITNPVALPAAQVNGVAFAPMGDYLAALGGTTPFLQTWPFDPSAGTFGTVIANPATLPLTGCGAVLGKAVAWRPQGDFIACADGTHVYVTGFNRITGAYTSTQLSDTPSAATVTCLQWTPDGQYLIAGFTASPFLKVYDFSGQTLGTSVAFDVSAPATQVNDIVVDKSGRFVMLSINASPGIQVFPLPTKTRNYLRV